MKPRSQKQADEVERFDPIGDGARVDIGAEDAARGRAALARFDPALEMARSGRDPKAVAGEVRQVIASALGDDEWISGLACAPDNHIASLLTALAVAGTAATRSLQTALKNAKRPTPLKVIGDRAERYQPDIGDACGWDCRGLTAPPGYSVDRNGIYMMTSEGSPVQVAAAPLAVTGILHGANNGPVSWVIEYDFHGRHRRVVVPRAAAMGRDMPSLLDGGPVGIDNARDVVRYLRQQEAANVERLPGATMYTSIGWQGDVFLAGRHALTAAGATTTADPASVPPSQWGDSARFVRDDGSFAQILDAITPTGRLADWRRLVSRAMVGRPSIALAVHAALASALLHVIPGAPLFVVEWAGDTSRGKSTALRVAASVWGDSNEGGVMQSWKHTPTYIERMAGFLSSLPVILDDTAKIEPRHRDNIASIVYMFTSGQGKGRGTPGQVQAVTRHRCLLLSSGETPLTSFSTSAGGTHARSVILRGAPLGPESDEAKRLGDELKEQLPAMGGDAGPAFVRWLLARRDRWAAFADRWRELSAEVSKGLDAAAAMRLAGPAALLLLAGELADEALDLPGSRGETRRLLRQAMTEGGEGADRPRAALEWVRSWAVTSRASFARHASDSAQPPRGTWVGRWDEGEAGPAIVATTLSDELRRAGFDAAATLTAWRERDWLVVTGDQRNPNVRLPGGPARCVVVRPAIWKDDDGAV